MEHEKCNSYTYDCRSTQKYYQEIGRMIRKTRYHTEYSSFPEDDIIRDSQDIEKIIWELKEIFPVGLFVMGFDSLHWDENCQCLNRKAESMKSE